MSLKSKRLAGDPKLEAAATSDQAHIVRGTSGAHVAKIQSALIELDGALISGLDIERSVYGPSTSHAVLAFKTKRNIVNRSYQTQADDIVGKMTIAVLDSEMLAKESVPDQPARLEPINARRRLSRSRATPIKLRPNLILGFAVSQPVQAPRPEFDNVANRHPGIWGGQFPGCERDRWCTGVRSKNSSDI